MDEVIYLAVNDTVGDAPATAVTTETAAPSGGTEASQTAAPSSMMSMNMQLILTMVAVFAIMYFFTIRPQRKREKEIKEIQDALKAGDWIVTFSGMYGKVVDVGAEIIMVEFGTNRGIRIPVRKTEVTKSKEPSLIAKKDDDVAETTKK